MHGIPRDRGEIDRACVVSAPRLEIDLDKIYHNARTLVERLDAQGISVTAITKATMGLPEITSALLKAGVKTLGDSRIENIEAMRRTGTAETISLIRSPMLSQVERVAAFADISFNSELEVIRRLSSVAQRVRRRHGIVLMVELGDLREGIMPDDLEQIVREMLPLPNLVLKGIGTNLACRSGVTPDAKNMAELSALAESIEAKFSLSLDIVSGGNSANLDWALGYHDSGRINNLRLGESILLGCEPLRRRPIEGLHTDAITLVAEVIESKVKPSKPWGKLGQTAFGDSVTPVTCTSHITQAILAVGEQDTDPRGLQAPAGIEILGASSDHLIVDSSRGFQPVGFEMRFQLNYSAMVRAMASPFVAKAMITR